MTLGGDTFEARQANREHMRKYLGARSRDGPCNISEGETCVLWPDHPEYETECVCCT